MRAAMLVLLSAALAGCRTPAEPEGPPAMSGRIVARDVTIPLAEPPTIHVKATTADGCGVVFVVRSSTRVHRRLRDGGLRPASASDLTVGRTVRVWATVVLDSCPGQSAATAVEILDGGD